MRSWLWGAVVVVAAARAYAGDDVATLKGRADAAMDAHHYDEAIAGYTAAYDASQNPAFLYNRGRAHEARGEYVLAYDDLDRFKKTATPELIARVPKLDELLADMASRVATLELSCNVPNARVLLGGRQIGTTPLGSIRVDAGHKTLEILGDGYSPYKKEVDLRGGGTTLLDVTLVAKAAVSPVPPVVVVRTPEAKHSSSIVASPWFWTVVGVVVVGGAVTIGAIAATSDHAPDNGTGFTPGRVPGP